jgi:predicted dehydrogenase
MTHGVLIGYGSAGRVDGRVLAGIVDGLAIVERSPQAQEAARKELPAAIVAPRLADLGASWRWDQTLAVIATWGTNHAEVFYELANFGVRHIACEKPLAHSVHAASRMIQQAREQGITIGVNHSWRYQGIANGLSTLARELSLGEPDRMLAHGGAAGIVTNGIHYIDLANQIFGGTPTAVLSTVSGDPINPRSPDLRFYGGTAVWSYENGREAVFSLPNTNSIMPIIHFYYRDAVVKMNTTGQGQVTVWQRDMDAVARFPAVTRTGVADRVIHDGSLPNLLSQEDSVTNLYHEVLADQVTTCPPQDALAALSACIGALSAGETGTRVSFPIEPDSEIGRREWPIS